VLTAQGKPVVEAVRAVEQLLDDVVAEARQQSLPMNRPLDEGTDEQGAGPGSGGRMAGRAA
jgi:hypothetical protein